MFLTLSFRVSLTVTTPVSESIVNGVGGPLVSKPKIIVWPPFLSLRTLVTTDPIGSVDITNQLRSTCVIGGRPKPGGNCVEAVTKNIL